MRAPLATIAVLLVAVATFAQDAPPGQRPSAGESVLAIVGGEVHTGDGVVLRRGTVLCRDGKIVGVGAALEVPEGARVIDAAGMWVLPGFVAPDGDNFGVRQGRPRGGESFKDNLDAQSRNAELALSAGITAFHGDGVGGGSIDTNNAILRPAYQRPELMVLRESAALSISWGRLQVTERTNLEGQLEKGKAWIAAGRQGRAPISTQMIDALDRKLPTRISVGDKSEIVQAVRFAKKYDLKLVLLGAYEAWLVPQEIAAAGAITVVTTRMRVWPSAGREDASGSSITTCGVLEKAGAKFCVLPPGGFGGRGTGIGLGGISGRDLLTYAWDAAFAVRGGASNEAALRAITLTAAEALGVEDRIGSLERGKDADIAIFQGDPFDYRNRAEITIVGGQVLYERAKSSFFSHLPQPRESEGK
jgi:imidazolonepropionase-like amidohydrolase